jgi:serine/threonine-protein kinase
VNEPHDPHRTVDVPRAPSDSLDAGLAAGFGRPADGPVPSSVLTDLRSRLGPLQPVLLGEAEGESAVIVQPKSDAMPPPEQTGERYQLQGEIARGGMGAVLRGRDVDLGRDLAIKVLLEKHANRPEVLRRFIEEAQIGGQLQHPGVVPVYDIGHFGERPFFTMKLVKGHTLQALLADRAEPAMDRPRFLGIALQVAQTLAYAHAKGVIHRDLKPANIMVGAFGEVQVMDWGLAKVLAEGGIADEEKARRLPAVEGTQIRTARSSGSGVGTDTEAGSLLGTPAYMPPEQAIGDVANLDRRADVFGLGAILCEILTGKPPYVGRSSEEVRRKACNGDLVEATARLDACGADAELIVLTRTCLAAEAIDRPRDAQAVADGLVAYLNGVQERLHQAELAEAEAKAKAIEEAKRRRLTLALAASVLLALALGGGGFLWVKSARDARQAQVARDVNNALNQATALREQAKTATTGGAALFAQAREHAQRALALIENGPANVALKDQVQHLKAELDEEEKDRMLITALDEARLAQAETLSENRFADERAIPKFREAFRAYGLPAGEGEPKVAAQRIRQRPAAVREAIVAALDEWDTLAGRPRLKITEPHRKWLRAVLETAEPDDAWGRKVRAARQETDLVKRQGALEALAKSIDVAKVPARALTQLAGPLSPPQAAELLRRAQEQYPADFWINHNLGVELQDVTPPRRDEAVRFLTAAVALRPDSPGANLNLGYALHYKGQVDEAMACFQKAIERDPKYGSAHNGLGLGLEGKGKVDEAIACYQKAIQLDPKDPAPHSNLGNALKGKGQLDEAIACQRKAVAIAPNYTRALNNLGVALHNKGQVEEAIACFRKAVALNPKHASAHSNLGNALLDKGQRDEAIACYHKAIALDPKSAGVHVNLGNALMKKGHDDEAFALYRKAIELDPKFALAHASLGKVLRDKGKVDEAIACFHKAIELRPKFAAAYVALGAALSDEKRDFDGAIACFQKAIELDPTVAFAHHHLGAALANKGQVDEAIPWFKKAIELDAKHANAHFALGHALDQKGQKDEAIACYKKAIELDPKLAEAHAGLGHALFARGQLEAAIACYRKAIELDPKAARFHHYLALTLKARGQVDAAITSFKQAIALDPKFASAHIKLGAILCDVKRDYDGAIACFRTAIQLDPKNAEAHINLGTALFGQGRVDAAITCLRKAISLDPKIALAHSNLGAALAKKGQVDEAIACLRKAIALSPKHSFARLNLGKALNRKGLALYRKGQADEAIACFREAVALDPKNADAHMSLGVMLCDFKRDYDGAITCFHKAIALAPKEAVAHFNLGNALKARGQVDEAIASWRKAIQLNPKHAGAHANLGDALQARGQVDEAIACYKKLIEIDPKDAATRTRLARATRLAAARDKLPAFQNGSYTPGSNAERLDLAEWCIVKKQYRTAARLYAAAFAADPKLGDDLKAGRRYDAACCAALGAAGQGVTNLDDKEKARLRKRALDWLRADLALRTKQLESGKPADRAAVQQTLRHWQKDTDLAGLRDKAALATLPGEERAACGNEPHDPGHTADHSCAPGDSLDAGLAAGFGPPRSNLGDLRPVELHPLRKCSSSSRSWWVQRSYSALVSQPRPPHILQHGWMRPACRARQRGQAPQ